jgi:hypothetical protein
MLFGNACSFAVEAPQAVSLDDMGAQVGHYSIVASLRREVQYCGTIRAGPASAAWYLNSQTIPKELPRLPSKNSRAFG